MDEQLEFAGYQLRVGSGQKALGALADTTRSSVKKMFRSTEKLAEKMIEVRIQLQTIPLLLRLGVILSCIVGVVVPLIALIPGVGVNIDGTPLSWEELWETGVAFALLAYGPIHLAIPYGVFQRKNWLCPLLVCFPIVQLLPFEVVQLIFGTKGGALSLYQYFPITLGFAIYLAIYAVAVGTFLYANRSVRAYFRQADAMVGR